MATRLSLASCRKYFSNLASLCNSVKKNYPGRVATLIPTPSQPDNRVWGVAYKIRDADISAVTKHLDFREKNGYSKSTVTFYPQNEEVAPFPLTVYVATEENESFAGLSHVDAIAEEVVTSAGPSGTNKQYVYCLAKAMRSIAPAVNDEHLFALEEAVRKIDPDFTGDAERGRHNGYAQ